MLFKCRFYGTAKMVCSVHQGRTGLLIGGVCLFCSTASDCCPEMNRPPRTSGGNPVLTPCAQIVTQEDSSVSFTREAKKSVLSGGADMRIKVTLACTECKQRNYNTMKNKKNDPDRLEMNKYCKFCRKHTLHKETK